MPLLPIINPAVGKSGPFICSINSSSVESLLSIKQHIASITSPILCGGILVAIPTAIPLLPFTNKLGNFVGKTTGSSNLSSKFGIKSTVSLSISVSISTDSLLIFASV